MYIWSITSLGMSVIYILLGISIIVAIFFFAVFVVATRKGQFDDGYTPSVRMLFEDELKKQESNQTNSKTD